MAADRPATAVALGDQVHAEMLERAMQAVAQACAAEGESLSEAERAGVELGVAAGVTATMQVLAARGWLRYPPA